VRIINTSLEGWGKIFKRIFDLVLSFLLLPFFLILYPIVAIFIKLDSKGPVIVKLQRVGEGGKLFYLYKFRSMIENAHQLKKDLLPLSERQGPLFKLKNDPRITRVGKFLRRFRIDEVPQIINVLKGDMSLVGPRPHEPEEVEKYLPYQKRLLSIKPGITGLAQISGASDLPFEKEVDLDTYYIENWSLLFDIKILIRTAFKIFFDPSAV
jgi:exopolysaccharide biosynthesis polyprenyl glycosylphosphotransferase